MEKGRIYLIPNLLSPNTIHSVLPASVKETVDTIEHFFAEDIRTARRFLSELKVSRKIEDLHFYKVDKDTSSAEIKKLFKLIPEEKNIGIVSEAGCPCIADPGSLVVYEAHKLERTVVPMVGPSSIVLALMASGLNGQSFSFTGYLPIDKEGRAKQIKQLEKESRQKSQTQLFIETPYRNNKLLEDLVRVCDPATKLCIAANLTGEKEFISTRTINEWKKRLPDLDKQPTIFLLYG